MSHSPNRRVQHRSRAPWPPHEGVSVDELRGHCRPRDRSAGLAAQPLDLIHSERERKCRAFAPIAPVCGSASAAGPSVSWRKPDRIACCATAPSRSGCTILLSTARCAVPSQPKRRIARTTSRICRRRPSSGNTGLAGSSSCRRARMHPQARRCAVASGVSTPIPRRISSIASYTRACVFRPQTLSFLRHGTPPLRLAFCCGVCVPWMLQPGLSVRGNAAGTAA